jgi:6-phosphogluconolactonase/glucosamine-6-phosphate isomerase/deaminase
MQFIVSANWEDAALALAGRLNKELNSNKKVLWLVSGGSNVAASKKIMRHISSIHTKNLSIMPVDERFGPADHADSNWAQLMEGGFDSKGAQLIPVLKDGLDFDQTAARYNNLCGQALLDNPVVIAQLGIGPDGHTAGIMPNSKAGEPNKSLVIHYEDLAYKRLTLSFMALKRITTAYVLAFGSNKKDALIAASTNSQGIRRSLRI